MTFAYNNGNYGYAGAQGGTAINVDLTHVEAAQGGDYQPLPAGEYHVFVEKAELRQSRTSGSQYLATQYRVAEGPYSKRLIFDRFCMWGENPVVALSMYKAFRESCGLNPNVGGTLEELYGKEFLCRVRLRQKYNSPGEMENNVCGYKPLTAPMPQQAPMGGGAYVQPTPQANPQAPMGAAPAPAYAAPVQQAPVQQQPQPSEEPSGGEFPW